MSNKAHPKSIRVGVIEDWNSKNAFILNKELRITFILENKRIYTEIEKNLKYYPISKFIIERPNIFTIHCIFYTINSYFILNKHKRFISKIKKIIAKITFVEVKILVLNVNRKFAYANILVNNAIISLEAFDNYRRVMHRCIKQSKFLGALGCKIILSGRLQGVELARKEKMLFGILSRNNLFKYKIDYAARFALTKYGPIGVKIWICYDLNLYKKKEKE